MNPETDEVLGLLSKSNYKILMENLLKQLPGLESKFIFESKLLSSTIAAQDLNASFEYITHSEDNKNIEWLDEQGIREVFDQMKLIRVLGSPFEAIRYSSFVLNSAVKEVKQTSTRLGQKLDLDGPIFDQLCSIDEEISKSFELIDKQKIASPKEIRLLNESLSLISKISDVIKPNSLKALEELLNTAQFKLHDSSDSRNNEPNRPFKRQKLALCDLLS